ncbi:hypothetical protein KKG83_05980 [Candidatus Micrarchaeota archaeon]|nr:hypothetical protein [Candidatus Micrarchaeota archaeon]MBU2420937.1 hypothetical protein [Nanoarchaeota archaeon]MBU2476992.1 hypothetical protein [Candidatus Micrarchaeota archaeon]
MPAPKKVRDPNAFYALRVRGRGKRRRLTYDLMKLGRTVKTGTERRKLINPIDIKKEPEGEAIDYGISKELHKSTGIQHRKKRKKK